MNLPFTTHRAGRGKVLNILRTVLTSASALMIITMQWVPSTTVHVSALSIQNKHEIRSRFAAQLISVTHTHTHTSCNYLSLCFKYTARTRIHTQHFNQQVQHKQKIKEKGKDNSCMQCCEKCMVKTVLNPG